MRTPVLILLLVVVLVIGLAVGAFVLGLPALNLIRPPEVATFSSKTVLSGLDSLAELTTYEAQFAKANIKVSVRYGVGGVCNVGASHAIQGSVRAAVDLSGVTEKDVVYNAEENTLTVTVPGAFLSVCSLDTVNIVQYDTFGRVPVTCPQPYSEFQPIAAYIAINEFRQNALDANLLDRAEKQARVVLEGLLKTSLAGLPNTTETNITINFDKTKAPAPSQSCVPNPPPGWNYDSARNRWDKAN